MYSFVHLRRNFFGLLMCLFSLSLGWCVVLCFFVVALKMNIDGLWRCQGNHILRGFKRRMFI